MAENLRTACFARQPFGMRALVGLGFAVALCACGGARAAPRESGVAPVARPSVPASPPTFVPRAESTSKRPPTLRRVAVRSAVAQGLGILLQRVELDDRPVRVGGKFYGFRIVALRDSAFWSGVDLKPGDVVTSVNGFPIERPEQAQTAFDSLEVASELRVAYDRDGQTRELVFAITEEH